jgi:hypothetical protein
VPPEPTEAPPAGVVLDGTLTVTFLQDGNDEPIAEAFVELTPRRADEELAGSGAWTDEQGVATFSELPRPDDGAEAIEWQLTASSVTNSYPNNCVQSSSWSGSVKAPAVVAAPPVTIHGLPASSIACGPDIVGSVVDADGGPFAVDLAQLVAVTEDGHEWEIEFEVAADGTFTVSAPPADSVHLTILSEVTRTAVAPDGCSYSYAWVVDEEIDLSGAEGDVGVELVASDEPVTGSCTTTPAPSDDAPAPTAVEAEATPPQTGNGPAVTPPATDTGGDAATSSTLSLSTLLLILLGGGMALVLAAPQARRKIRR